MTASHLLRLQLLTAAAFVVLAASCGGAPGTPAPAPPIPGAACDLSASGGIEAGGRFRAWVLYLVKDPQAAVAGFSKQDDKGLTLLTEGADNYVIVRADVVDGNNDFNLVVPVDAANEAQFMAAQDRLTAVLGGPPSSVLRVVEHCPTPPHMSNTFVTDSELKGYYLKEYDPAGRHPKSPGANPWG
jgi:hypothetical protein